MGGRSSKPLTEEQVDAIERILEMRLRYQQQDSNNALEGHSARLTGLIHRLRLSTNQRVDEVTNRFDTELNDLRERFSELENRVSQGEQQGSSGNNIEQYIDELIKKLGGKDNEIKSSETADACNPKPNSLSVHIPGNGRAGSDPTEAPSMNTSMPRNLQLNSLPYHDSSPTQPFVPTSIQKSRNELNEKKSSDVTLSINLILPEVKSGNQTLNSKSEKSMDSVINDIVEMFHRTLPEKQGNQNKINVNKHILPDVINAQQLKKRLNMNLPISSRTVNKNQETPKKMKETCYGKMKWRQENKNRQKNNQKSYLKDNPNRSRKYEQPESDSESGSDTCSIASIASSRMSCTSVHKRQKNIFWTTRPDFARVFNYERAQSKIQELIPEREASNEMTVTKGTSSTVSESNSDIRVVELDYPREEETRRNGSLNSVISGIMFMGRNETGQFVTHFPTCLAEVYDLEKSKKFESKYKELKICHHCKLKALSRGRGIEYDLKQYTNNLDLNTVESPNKE